MYFWDLNIGNFVQIQISHSGQYSKFDMFHNIQMEFAVVNVFAFGGKVREKLQNINDDIQDMVEMIGLVLEENPNFYPNWSWKV